MVEAEPGASYDGVINCDAVGFSFQCILLFDAGWSLWEQISASRLLGIALIIKVVLLALSAFALYRVRPWAWACAVSGLALYGAVVPFTLVTSAIRMSPSNSSISALMAWWAYGGAAIIVAVLASTSYLFWKSYRMFEVLEHHRWRLLVRIGLPSALLLLVIDAYRLYDGLIR